MIISGSGGPGARDSRHSWKRSTINTRHCSLSTHCISTAKMTRITYLSHRHLSFKDSQTTKHVEPAKTLVGLTVSRSGTMSDCCVLVVNHIYSSRNNRALRLLCIPALATTGSGLSFRPVVIVASRNPDKAGPYARQQDLVWCCHRDLVSRGRAPLQWSNPTPTPLDPRQHPAAPDDSIYPHHMSGGRRPTTTGRLCSTNYRVVSASQSGCYAPSHRLLPPFHRKYEYQL